MPAHSCFDKYELSFNEDKELRKFLEDIQNEVFGKGGVSLHTVDEKNYSVTVMILGFDIEKGGPTDIVNQIERKYVGVLFMKEKYDDSLSHGLPPPKP